MAQQVSAGSRPGFESVGEFSCAVLSCSGTMSSPAALSCPVRWPEISSLRAGGSAASETAFLEPGFAEG